MTKIAIIGSRDFTEYALLKSTVLNYMLANGILCDVQIVSGGAIGADKLGEKFSKDMDLPEPLIFLPDWDKHGKSAGFIRNKLIIEASDVVFAFWNGTSKGTLSSINLAKNMNKKLYVIDYVARTINSKHF